MANTDYKMNPEEFLVGKQKQASRKKAKAKTKAKKRNYRAKIKKKNYSEASDAGVVNSIKPEDVKYWQ